MPGILANTRIIRTRFSAVLGLRADHNSLFWFLSNAPALTRVSYEPVHGTGDTLQGRGRTAGDLRGEYQRLCARQLNIICFGAGKAYGLT